jgi:hypothetical protein
MAFLDNSGTIILDAILTDLGRKRMAHGNFKVVKFALGDDEIDYSFIDQDKILDYDFDNIELLTPMEAFNANNACINHGLVNYTSDDILYVPIIKQNEALRGSVKKYNYDEPWYYLSVNDETTKKLKSILGSPKYYLENYSVSRNKIIFESGIDNPDIKRDRVSRERYILNYNLLDKYFIISCDRRFVSKLLVVDHKTAFVKNDPHNKIHFNFESLHETPPLSLAHPLSNFVSYIGKGIDNLIYSYRHMQERKYSAIQGPRGTMCVFNIKLIEELTGDSLSTRDFRYIKFGSINQTPFGGSSKFDYIDTTIQIQGVSTFSKLQIPIRILRYAGT